MRFKEFIVEYRHPNEQKVHRAGLDLESIIVGRDFQITASSHGREMGRVLFHINDNTLIPDDLWVEEQYRGQGIAAVMYDWAKELGYRVVRSDSQTDDGKHFWDKNRGEAGQVWEAELAEIARIPKSELAGWGDKDTIEPQQEPKGSKPLPGGSGYKYHVNRKGSDFIEITLYDKGQIIAELDLEELGAPIPLWRVETVVAIPEYQGRGLGMSLYGIALSILKLTLVAGETQTQHGARQWLKLSQIPGVEVMGMKTAPKNNFKQGPDNIVLWQGPEMITYTFPITQGSKSMKSAQRGVGIYNSAGATMIAKWTGK